MPPVRLLLGLAAAAFAAAVAAMPAHGVPPAATPYVSSGLETQVGRQGISDSGHPPTGDNAWAALDEVAETSMVALGPFEPAVRLARRPDRTLARRASFDVAHFSTPSVDCRVGQGRRGDRRPTDSSSTKKCAASSNESEGWSSPAEPLVVVKYDESSDESSVSQAAAIEEFDALVDEADEGRSLALRASVGTEGDEVWPVNDVRVSSLRRFNPLRGHPIAGAPQAGEWVGRNPLRTSTEPLTDSPASQFPSMASENDVVR